MNHETILLPETAGSWKQSAPPRRITKHNIFDYMNGGGELYLAFLFDHMMAYEYSDGSGNDILVELYFMRKSDDAFGLLSLDWGGEARSLPHSKGKTPPTSVVPGARALYGAGLLRLCAGSLYARIMAFRETPAARDALLMLSKAVVKNRSDSPIPGLLKRLPSAFSTDWQLQPKRTAWFRSHLILNSLYYLSHENILNLDPACEAAFSVYERGKERIQLLVIHYPDTARAAKALRDFTLSYVPEQAREPAPDSGESRSIFQVEDGWLGCRLESNRLWLVFGCPDRQSARRISDQLVSGQ